MGLVLLSDRVKAGIYSVTADIALNLTKYSMLYVSELIDSRTDGNSDTKKVQWNTCFWVHVAVL